MLHLFLDANIYLGLHGLRPSEVDELRKLVALVEEGEVTLWLPEVVVDEYRRNRPKVVAEALKAFREARITAKPPELARGRTEQEVLQAAVREVNRAHSALLDALDAEARDEILPADAVVAELFRVATKIPTEGLLPAARERRELRRPPGKAESFGDALSWEALLQAVPEFEGLYLVSGDSDFRSPLSGADLHEYLEDEWSSRQTSEAKLYTDLGSFLQDHFAAVNVPSDIPKLRLIQQLADTLNFEATHNLIEQLGRYDVFTPEQARLIVRNSVRNNQVRWIAGDDDVREFLTRIIDTHRSTLDSGMVEILERVMTGDEPAYARLDLDGEVL